MKRIITMLAIMVMTLTGMSQTYSNTNTRISESNITSSDSNIVSVESDGTLKGIGVGVATITIDSNIVSFDAIYTPFTLFSSPINVHRSGICSINEIFDVDIHITTYTNIENKFQVSVIETSNETTVTLSYYVIEQEREAVKLVTIN